MENIGGFLLGSGGGGLLGVSLRTSFGYLLGIRILSNEGFGYSTTVGLSLGETYMAPIEISYGIVGGVILGEDLIMIYGRIQVIRRGVE